MSKKEEVVIQAKVQELYALLLVKHVDVIAAHKLLQRIYNVAWYRSQIQTAQTPELTALARWSADSAREELDTLMHSLNLCDVDRHMIRYIANHYEF